MKNKKGFSLIEVLVTIGIFSIISGAIYSVYLFNQKAYRDSETLIEITQNARVISERMTREIRQAKDIVTDLDDQEPQESVNPATGIIFEDGHITDSYNYIRYFKDGADIKREVVGYYFSGNPGTLVPFGSTPPQGQTLATTTLESAKVIGEYASGLKFWGTKLINISVSLQKNGKSILSETGVLVRNF